MTVRLQPDRAGGEEPDRRQPGQRAGEVDQQPVPPALLDPHLRLRPERPQVLDQVVDGARHRAQQQPVRDGRARSRADGRAGRRRRGRARCRWWHPGRPWGRRGRTISGRILTRLLSKVYFRKVSTEPLPPETQPGPPRDLGDDPLAMRALAHPVRIRLLEELTFRGPLTATQAAAPRRGVALVLLVPPAHAGQVRLRRGGRRRHRPAAAVAGRVARQPLADRARHRGHDPDGGGGAGRPGPPPRPGAVRRATGRTRTSCRRSGPRR